MDRPPLSPPPELKNDDDAVEEHERGISFPFMNEEDEEEDECGVEGFRWENGELLRARDDDDDAIEFTHRVDYSVETNNFETMEERMCQSSHMAVEQKQRTSDSLRFSPSSSSSFSSSN